MPNGTFPLFISAPGYLDFLSTFSFSGGGTYVDNYGNVQHTPTITYFTRTALLYPIQNVEEDVHVSVYDGDQGDPIASGQVVAVLDSASGVAAVLANDLSSTFAPVLSGLQGGRPNAVVASLSNGTVTLAHDSLVFGATYRINVISARDASGRYLQPVTTGNTFRAGIDAPELTIFMGPPAACPVALSANNEDSSGTESSLVVTFPYEVEICNDDTDPTWSNTTPFGVNGQDTDNDGVVGEPPTNDDPKVTLALSEGNTVLTATANFDAEDPNRAFDPDDQLYETFGGIKVQVMGSLNCTPLSSIDLRHLPSTPGSSTAACSGSGATVDTQIIVQNP